MPSKDPTKEDYLAVTRDALSAAIRELASASSFADSAGDDELHTDIGKALHSVRVLRSRMCLTEPK